MAILYCNPLFIKKNKPVNPVSIKKNKLVNALKAFINYNNSFIPILAVFCIFIFILAQIITAM